MSDGMFSVRTWDPSVTVFGWWIRLIWGVTGRPGRFRWHHFYGHRLLALRLWGVGRGDGRLIGIQWRRSRDAPKEETR